MNTRRFFRLLFVPLALAGLGLAGCGRERQVTTAAGKAAPPPAPAKLLALGPAPAWQLKDVNGNVVRSEQFQGKVVVVDFWATWCGPCLKEIPGYADLQRKYGKDGLAIVGVSLDQAGPGVVRDFIAKYGINYQIVMGTDETVAAFGGMEAIPTTFLIDRTGQIRDRKVGVEPAEVYEQKIAALLN